MFESIIDFINSQTPLFYWTQSLWRDEAFSVWIAQDGITEAFRRTSGDFNSPFYYILLYFWMRIFGRSEVALRGLSVLAFLLFLIVVLKFSRHLFRSEKAAEYTTILMAVNPMLLYYAFELRMYSLLILFTALSMYMLYVKNWKWYIVSATLGMYAHPFMAFVILAQNIYLAITHRFRTTIRNDLLILLFYLPWLPTLYSQFQTSGPMWIYPVDLNLVLSVLGNLYVGYEGTPGHLWPLMWVLSALFIGGALSVWKRRAWRKHSLFFIVMVAVPLTVVLGISLVKPIYVNRYVIFVTVTEVYLLSFYIVGIKNRNRRRAIATVLLLVTFLTNFLAVSFHRKVDIRSTFGEILPQLTPDDVIYAATPLVYYESLYYTSNRIPVFLYNPQRITVPRYAAAVGMPPEVWATTVPLFPRRAFIVQEDGRFRLVSQGS